MTDGNVDIANQECEVCQVGAPTLTDSELETYLLEIPGWDVIELDSVKQLQREFIFSNFVEAQQFANRVGGLAEEFGHHPAILIEWGKVSVRWWTHKIHGLHKSDVILAAKTSRLFD